MFSYSSAIIILLVYYSMCIDNSFEMVSLRPSASCGKDSEYTSITELLFRKTV